MEHAFEQNDDEILSGLQAAAGDQDVPSPQQGPASQGALGAPAPAGGNSQPTELAAGQTYFDIWNEGSEEDRQANLDALEEQLGLHGSGVLAKVNEIASTAMAEKDGKTLNLLLKWGWKPSEERPAFNPGEA